MNGIWPWSRFNALEQRIKALEDASLIAVPDTHPTIPGFMFYPMRDVVSRLMYDAGYRLQRGTSQHLVKGKTK